MFDRRFPAPRHWATHALALLSALIVFPALARAETSIDPTIRTDPLILSGTIESKPIDVSRTLRLRLIGNDDKQVTIRGTASDLVRDGQPGLRPLQIPATSISVDERSAKPGQVVDLPVAIKGIASPGVYRGTLALTLDNSAAAASTVKLELYAGVKPAVDVLDKSVAVSVSNCSGSCSLTELAVPGSTKAGTSHIAVLNRSPASLVVVATVDGLRGARVDRPVRVVAVAGGRRCSCAAARGGRAATPAVAVEVEPTGRSGLRSAHGGVVVVAVASDIGAVRQVAARTESE